MNMQRKIYQTIIPFLFVTLYGSGFIGTKHGLEYSNPLSFLFSRFLAASLILVIVAFVLVKITKTVKPKIHSLRETLHITVAGLLTVATFSVGVFMSIDKGLPPSVSAMVIALQPILVTLLAIKMMNERVTKKQWLGLVLGLLGVFMVLLRNVTFNLVGFEAMSLSILALLGLTIGNVYQKHYCSDMGLLYGGAVQSGVSAMACLMLLLWFGEFEIHWTKAYIFAWGYMTVGVSIGALSLLYIMIRHGSVTKVASMFYLMPVAAVIVSSLFGIEQINVITFIGIGVVFLAILFTTKSE